MISATLHERWYSDDRYKSTSAFYRWVRQHTNENVTLLNLGAGPPTHNPVRIFKGQIACAVGADVDPIVLKNDELDEAHVIEDGVLPLRAESFDVVLSDFVLEHVEQPALFITEVYRVLKPGGSFFFRTPNKYHYVALTARLTPHWFHRVTANRVRGLSEDAHEPWRTFYRLNSRHAIERLSKQVGFRRAELRMVEGEPSYLIFHACRF